MINAELSLKEKQQILIDAQLLPAPADGKWGPLSQAAYQDFEILGEGKPLQEFAGTKGPIYPLKAKQGNGETLAGKVYRYMRSQRYTIYHGRRRLNLVGIEGMYPNGNLNPDRLDEWNDCFLALEIIDNQPQITGGPWLGTTEPGFYYRKHRLNPDGAFQIALEQHRFAWCFGLHKNYEALVQCAPVTGYRDTNGNGIRDSGDKKVTGSFDINFHHGWDAAKVGRNSAGCQVIRGKNDFAEALRLLKSDVRYQANPSYRFTITVIDGSKL